MRFILERRPPKDGRENLREEAGVGLFGQFKRGCECREWIHNDDLAEGGRSEE
jgi:hypothetical protein